MRSSFLAIFAASMLMLSGCRHQIRIESTPPGAAITVNDKAVGVTPADITTIWWPMRKLPVSVSLPGYRKVNFNAGRAIRVYEIIADILSFRTLKLLGKSPRRTHQIIMIRRHGRVGSWTPDDARRMR